MNEIIQRVTWSEEKASAAMDTVVGYLKEKLPAAMAAQIDSAGGMAGSVGGRFGGDNEQ